MFAFAELDKRYKKIRGSQHKQKVAKYRLEYLVDLTDEMKKMYENYLKRIRQHGENNAKI